MKDIGHDEIVKPVKGRWSFAPGGVAVMVSNAGDLAYLAKVAGYKADAGRNFIMSKVYVDSGLTFALVGPVVGAAYAAILLENLIAWGIREIIYFGWCGSLSADLGIGDILIPSGALTDEGASIHYQGKSGAVASADPAIRQKLEMTLTRQHAAYQQGIVWTTDGLFRETCDKVAFVKSKGAIAVDMETSALFTAAKYRQAALGTVLVASDDLSTMTWRPGFNNPRFLENRKQIADSLGRLLPKAGDEVKPNEKSRGKL